MPHHPHTQPWSKTLTRHYDAGVAFVPAPVEEPTPLFTSEKLTAIHQQLEGFFGAQPIPALTGRIKTLIYDRLQKGYLIPEAWLETPPAEYRRTLFSLARFHNHFGLADYLSAIHAAAIGDADNWVPSGLAACFHYPFAEALMIGRGGARAGEYERLSTGRPLCEHLHVVQWLEVMRADLYTNTVGNGSAVDARNVRAAAGEAVRMYFETHFTALSDWFAAAITSQGTATPPLPLAAEADFYQLCAADFDRMAVDALLSGSHDHRLRAEALDYVREVRSAPPPPASVFDRIDAFTHHPAPASAPGSTENLRGSFAHLRAEQRERLTTYAEETVAIRNALPAAYAKRLAALLNQLMGPPLQWVATESLVLPIFAGNALTDATARYQTFSAEQILYTKEAPELRTAISGLHKFRTEARVRRYAEGVSFFSRQAAAAWEKALANRYRILAESNRYRLDKMLQYGVTAEDADPREIQLYLDAIIEIEKEITPFIPFVRQAFKTALPIRSRVEFDEGRHAIDGPEFDPDTLTQPDKYLRGEVMKTFREERRQIPILQANAFCLDYSQSMTHAPMRNLFKIMFLLILGLENHRTHDAIYFFGDEFMETVNFQDGFTSRRIIFDLIRQVAEKNGDGLWWRGKGYTNISSGIRHSCTRLSTFCRELEAREPGTHIVRSLFVLTDGEPNAGIWQPDKLRDFVQQQREEHRVTIKGIFLDTGSKVGDVVSTIFGPENTVETDNFEDAVITFVGLMTRTYKRQRQAYLTALKQMPRP